MITLENLETYTVPLHEHPMRWLFEDADGNPPPDSYRDQILPLNKEASHFLWKMESDFRIGEFFPHPEKMFRDIAEFSFGENMEKDVKKWLYRRGIPFRQKVFVVFQPDTAFIMTWKMVVHFSPDLFFGHDLIVWDNTVNWALLYNHNDYFIFGRNRIFDGQEERLRYNALIAEIKAGIKKQGK